jgi:hypothetical protein
MRIVKEHRLALLTLDPDIGKTIVRPNLAQGGRPISAIGIVSLF